MTDKQYYVSNRDVNEDAYHYTESGLNNIYLNNGFTLSEFEGEQYVSINNVDGLHKQIALDIFCQNKIINGDEIRFLRSECRMTQAEVAKNLKVTDQQVARWEKGESKLTGGSDVALRFFFLSCDFLQPDGEQIVQRFFKIMEKIARRVDNAADAVFFDFEDDAREWAGHPAFMPNFAGQIATC